MSRPVASALAPVILVGVGRSGSTALHRALALHDGFAGLTGAADRWPNHPSRNRRLVQARTWPLVGPWLRRRLAPGECYEFWQHHRPGLRRPYRDLLASDVLPRDRRVLPAALAAALPPGRVPLLKFTGWPRVGFLAEIFPQARFVHVLRDGRAVAASLLEVNFWRGWQGPGGWRWGPLPPELDALWRDGGESFCTLAGLQWQRLVEAMEEARRPLPPQRFLEVRYEDLCADPATTLDRILSFSGLSEAPPDDAEAGDGISSIPRTAGSTVRRRQEASFHRRRARLYFRSANDKWRQRLSPEQAQGLETSLAPILRRYGYLTS